MKVLVTGGAGFIGSAVARLLIKTGRQVVVVDKLTYAGNMQSLREISGSPHFSFVRGDIATERRCAPCSDFTSPMR